MNFEYPLIPLVEELKGSDQYWRSFLEKPNFELGVLVLKPDNIDTQSPHKSDEVYFIMSGNGILTINGEDHPIKPHTAYYVPKLTSHNFHSNTEVIIAYYALN